MSRFVFTGEEVSQSPSDYPEEIRHIINSALSVPDTRISRVVYLPWAGELSQGHLYIRVHKGQGTCHNQGSGHIVNGRFEFLRKGPVGMAWDRFCSEGLAPESKEKSPT